MRLIDRLTMRGVTRRWAGGAALAAGAALPLAAQAAAQPPSEPGVGQRVRLVTRDGRRVTGTVEAVGRDTVRLGRGGKLVASFPAADVAAYQASAGRDHWRGARRGALVGAAAGVVLVGWALHEDSNASDVFIPATVFAVPAAAVLVVVGAGVGGVLAPERWDPPAPVRVGSARPSLGGPAVRVGLARRF